MRTSWRPSTSSVARGSAAFCGACADICPEPGIPRRRQRALSTPPWRLRIAIGDACLTRDGRHVPELQGCLRRRGDPLRLRRRSRSPTQRRSRPMYRLRRLRRTLSGSGDRRYPNSEPADASDAVHISSLVVHVRPGSVCCRGVSEHRRPGRRRSPRRQRKTASWSWCWRRHREAETMARIAAINEMKGIHRHVADLSRDRRRPRRHPMLELTRRQMIKAKAAAIAATVAGISERRRRRTESFPATRRGSIGRRRPAVSAAPAAA